MLLVGECFAPTKCIPTPQRWEYQMMVVEFLSFIFKIIPLLRFGKSEGRMLPYTYLISICNMLITLLGTEDISSH